MIFLHLIHNLFNKLELFFLGLLHLISLLHFGAKNIIANVYFFKKITFSTKIYILFSTKYMFSHLLSLITSIKKYHLLCNLINFSIIYIYLQKINHYYLFSFICTVQYHFFSPISSNFFFVICTHPNTLLLYLDCMLHQGGHILVKIKFPVFSLSFPCVTNFFPVFFFHKINRWF